MTTKRKPALMLTALLAFALCLMLAVCVLTACNDGGSGNQDGSVAKPFANNTPVPTKLLNALFYYTYTNGSNQQEDYYLFALCYSDAAYIDETYDNSFIHIYHAQLNEDGQISGVRQDFYATIHADNASAQEHFDKGIDYTSGPYTYMMVDPESFVYENAVVTVSAESGFADLLNSSAPLAIKDNENIGKIMGAMPSATGKGVLVRFGGDSHDFEAAIWQYISPEYGADSRLEKWSSFLYAYPGETFDAETSESADSLTQSFEQSYNDSTNWSCSVERTAASLEIECATKPGVTYSSYDDRYTVDEFCYDADHRPAEVTVPAEINGVHVTFYDVQLPSFVTDLYLPGRDIFVVGYRTIDDFRYEGDTTLLTIHGDDWVYQLGDGADNSALKLSAPTGLTFDADSMTLSWDAHPSDMCDGYWLDIRAEYPNGRGDSLAEDVSISADATSLDVSQYVADVLGGIFSATLQFTFYAEHVIEVSDGIPTVPMPTYDKKTELDSDDVTITYEYDGIEFDPTDTTLDPADKTMVDFSGVQIPRALLNIALNTALILPQMPSEATIESYLSVMSDDEINNMLASNSDILGSLDNVSGALALGLLAISENDLGTDADIFGAAVVFETEAAAQKYAAAQNAKDPAADTRICITFANTVIIIAATQAIDIINLTQGIIPTLNTLMNTPVSGDADETKFIEFFYDTVLHTTDLKEITFGGSSSFGGLTVNAIGYEDEVEGESLIYQTPAVLCETPEIAAEFYNAYVNEFGMPLRLDGRFVYGSFMIRQNGTDTVFEDLL